MSDVGLKLAHRSQATGERRRGPRHLTLMRVGVIHGPESDDFCLVRNISAGGLMACVYRHIRRDEEVRIELTTGHILVGDVVWARGPDIGVQFRVPIDVANVLSTRCGPETDRRPRLPRLDLSCTAIARYGARSFTVQVGNISQRGAKIVALAPIPNLSGIVLGLRELPSIHAVVRWSHDDGAGLFFKESLPFAVLARWVDERRQLERVPQADWSASLNVGTLDR